MREEEQEMRKMGGGGGGGENTRGEGVFVMQLSHYPFEDVLQFWLVLQCRDVRLEANLRII